MIDMNKGFPLFRSRFRDRLTKDEEAYYLPSLEEYAHPFSSAGFEHPAKGKFLLDTSFRRVLGLPGS